MAGVYALFGIAHMRLKSEHFVSMQRSITLLVI